MATTELTQTPSAGSGETLRRLIRSALARLAALRHSARNRRAVVRLLEWDDHMLRDIGLRRNEVRAALAAPISDDPSRYLSMMWRERYAVSRAAEERLVHHGLFYSQR